MKPEVNLGPKSPSKRFVSTSSIRSVDSFSYEFSKQRPRGTLDFHVPYTTVDDNPNRRLICNKLRKRDIESSSVSEALSEGYPKTMADQGDLEDQKGLTIHDEFSESNSCVGISTNKKRYPLQTESHNLELILHPDLYNSESQDGTFSEGDEAPPYIPPFISPSMACRLKKQLDLGSYNVRAILSPHNPNKCVQEEVRDFYVRTGPLVMTEEEWEAELEKYRIIREQKLNRYPNHHWKSKTQISENNDDLYQETSVQDCYKRLRKAPPSFMKFSTHPEKIRTYHQENITCPISGSILYNKNNPILSKLTLRPSTG